MAHTYKYPRPAVTVDAVVFGVDAGALRVLLIKRSAAPFKDHWALPGGFVQMNESLDEAVRRELREETGIAPAYLEQLYTFGAPRRDPRGRVIDVAYLALVKLSEHQAAAASDAADAQWFDVGDLPELAFDHAEILRMAKRRLRAKAQYAPIGFDLVPKRFSLVELQKLYEIVLGRGLDKGNFRKKILGTGLLKDTGEQSDAVRPARLYEFDAAEYDRLTRRGFNFEI